MARRRGYFAELQRQQAIAARNRQREAAAAERERRRLEREMERHRAAMARAQAAHDKQERARLHVERQTTKAQLLTAELQLQLSELDGLLRATLDVDDYVDLESLRTTAQHPPFSSPHQTPLPAPELPQAPPEPVFVPPDAPTGLSAMLGGKKKHQAAVVAAHQQFAVIHEQWQQRAAQVPAMQLDRVNAHRKADANRRRLLEVDEARYRKECAERQHEADKANARLDHLIEDLAEGQAAAVEEYLLIVFSNSVYPDYFPAVSEWQFDAGTGELAITFDYPRPDQLPTIKQYRYVKAKDEIVPTNQTQKEQRDRYASVVHQAALRTLHEVWESDRQGHVRTISFTGRVGHIDPATGHESRTDLVRLAVAREQFAVLELGRVTPAETLKHLKATVSKNPHGMVGVGTGPSVQAH